MATSILQIVAALSGAETLWMFTALMMVNVGLVGFIGSNFGSIAMEDFGHMAGVASSYQSFAKTLLAATVGATIGQQYDGTTLPIAYAFLIRAVRGLALVFWADRGTLSTRPGTAPTRDRQSTRMTPGINANLLCPYLLTTQKLTNTI